MEKDPKARAVLAKHGISRRELVLATFAMMHAGMYVSMVSMLDPKARSKALAGYTKKQKTNIALMRTFAAQKKK